MQEETRTVLTAEQLRELQRKVEEKLLNQIISTVGSDSLLDSCAAYKAFKEALIT